jgi:hypothetical protein
MEDGAVHKENKLQALVISLHVHSDLIEYADFATQWD